MLPNSPSYTKQGHEKAEEEVISLLPRLTPFPNGNVKLTRWDGKVGSANELSKICLEEIRQAVSEPSGGEWVDLGKVVGISREYHTTRSAAGNGNRFFRFKAEVKVPPQLFAVALLEPTIIGNIDETVRHIRVLHNFPDGLHRLVYVVAEAGPRPLFLDRDDCALSAYYPPNIGGENSYWQVSCTCPSHFPSVSTAVRNHTMYWGYKLTPFEDPVTKQIHTRLTLISQTEIFGWLPKFLVNQMIPGILAHYIRRLEKHLVELTERGAPAKLLVESYGLQM